MVIVILAVSFLLRLVSINQSLWLDEAISVNIAKNFSFSEIISSYSVQDFHPPLHYLFLKVWGILFSWSEISVRMPSIIFSLIAIYFAYKIGRLIKNKNTGLWAAVFLGSNPLFVYYSQEARMYAMAVMFLAGCTYFFLKISRASKKINKADFFWFNLLSLLSFITFYGSIFLLASFAIYFLIKKNWKSFFATNIGIFISILIISPLLLTQLNNSKTMLNEVTNWSLVLGKVTLKNLLLIPIKFSIGRISFYPKAIYYFIGGLWSLVVFFLAFKKFWKNKIFTYLFVAPLILGTFFSIFSPLMQYFRFLYLLPIMAVLLALLKTKVKIFLGFGFVIFSFIYLINSNFHREDWKSLSKSLGDNHEVYMIGSFADPIKYYRNDVIIKDIRDRDFPEEISVIPYGEIIHGVNHNDILEKQGYKKIDEKLYRELMIENWKR